jgi:hypothetical protein
MSLWPPSRYYHSSGANEVHHEVPVSGYAVSEPILKLRTSNTKQATLEHGE